MGASPNFATVYCSSGSDDCTVVSDDFRTVWRALCGVKTGGAAPGIAPTFATTAPTVAASARMASFFLRQHHLCFAAQAAQAAQANREALPYLSCREVSKTVKRTRTIKPKREVSAQRRKSPFSAGRQSRDSQSWCVLVCSGGDGEPPCGLLCPSGVKVFTSIATGTQWALRESERQVKVSTVGWATETACFHTTANLFLVSGYTPT